MADTVATIRPNGVFALPASWYGPPADVAPFPGGWEDDDDATYWATGVVDGAAIVDLTDISFPAFAVVHSVTVRVRANNGLSVAPTPSFEALLVNSALGAQSVGRTPDLDATIRTYTLGTLTSIAGVGLTPAEINAMRLELIARFGTDQDAYELYVDVTYNQAPTVVVASPASPVVDTTKPLVSWVYSDAEGDGQERYRLKVFESSVYGGAGFDFETSPAAYDSGEVISLASTATMGPLPNGFTYKPYVKAADAGSGGRYGPPSHGAAFTMAAVTPAIPTLTATPDPALSRVQLSINQHDNLLTLEAADFISTVGGWVATNAAIEWDATNGISGGGCIKVTAAANGDITVSGPAGGVSVDANRQYTALASLRAASARRQGQIAVGWYNGSSVLISTSTGAQAGEPAGVNWIQETETDVSPPAAATAGLTVTIVGCLAGEVHYLDRASLAPGASTVWAPGGSVGTADPDSIQRSADGGSTWTSVRQGAAFGFVNIDQQTLVWDYEMPRGITMLYRARSTKLVNGQFVSSPYSATASARLDADSDWLKVVAVPASNMQICLAAPGPTTSDERQVVSEPLDRAAYAVQGDIVRGEVIPLAFSFLSDAEWQAFEAVRRLQAVMLLQTTWGDGTGAAEQFYVRLGPTRSVTRMGGGVGFLRSVTIQAREVSAPS